MIEHRKKHRLTRLHETNPMNSTGSHLPVVPRKPFLGHKKRSDSTFTTPRNSLNLKSNSQSNFHSMTTNGNPVILDGRSDPLPRRQRLSSAILNSPIVPTEKTKRPHSRSLATIEQPNFSLTSHKICTEV